MDDYISKPIDRRELAELLDRWRPQAPGPGPGEDPSGAAGNDDAPGSGEAGRRADEVLDRRVYESLVEDLGEAGPALFGRLIDTFLSDTPNLLEAIRAAVAGGRTADARRAAHTLKSTSASLGATTLASLCQQAESLSADGRLEAVGPLVAEIEAEYEQAETALRSLHASLAME